MWRQRPKALELLIMYGLTTTSLTSTMRRSSHYIFRIFTLFVSLPFEDHSSSNRKLAIPIFFSQRTFKFWSWLILAAFLQFLRILSYPIFRKALLFFIRKLQTRSYKLVLQTSVTTSFHLPCFFSFAFWKLPLIRSFSSIRCFSFVTFRPWLHIRLLWGLALVIAISIALYVEDSLTNMGRTSV